MNRAHLRAVKPPEPPPNLSNAGQRLWNEITGARTFAPAELPVLAAGLEQLETYAKAMESVRADGPVVTNPATGNPKANPALAAAHAALRAYRQAMGSLDLDVTDDGFRARGSLSRGRR